MPIHGFRSPFFCVLQSVHCFLNSIPNGCDKRAPTHNVLTNKKKRNEKRDGKHILIDALRHLQEIMSNVQSEGCFYFVVVGCKQMRYHK